MQCIDCQMDLGKVHGRKKRCGPCAIRAKADYYQRWYAEHGRRRSPEAMAQQKIALFEWRRKNPKKLAAHKAVASALKRGELIRPDRCSQCQDIGYVVAHHPNYSKPLLVIWLCDSCHMRLHGQLKSNTDLKPH